MKGFTWRIGAFLSSLFACLFTQITSVQAITIDKFDGTQGPVFVPVGDPVEETVALNSVIGGFRTTKTQTQAGTPSIIGVSGGFLTHSQGALGTGYSLIVWDGDSVTSNINLTGLGGINFLEDGGTAIRIKGLIFDFPSQQPAALEIALFDGSDPNSAKISRATLSLTRSYNSEDIEIPFTSFIPGESGGADLSKIGAITLVIDGKNPDVDLLIDSIGTNGSCDTTPVNGKVLDQCGVCGGDNSSCKDCKGVPNGTAKPSTSCETGEVGVCSRGAWSEECECKSIIPASIETCDQLDNNCNGQIDEIFDVCGVCGGDGISCLDCKGTPFGVQIKDSCGVCGGDNSTCLGCTAKDLTATSFVLDSGAKRQEKIIKSMLNRIGLLKKDSKTRLYIEKTKILAHSLQIRNWVLSWTLPAISVECSNKIVCVDFSIADIMNEYRSHNEELRALGLSVAKEVKRAAKGKLNSKDRLLLRQTEEQFKTNLDFANSIPSVQSRCL